MIKWLKKIFPRKKTSNILHILVPDCANKPNGKHAWVLKGAISCAAADYLECVKCGARKGFYET